MPKLHDGKETDLKRPLVGRLTCAEKNCYMPKGARGEGFTLKGLARHRSIKHSNALPTFDAGVPGDEVVMGIALDPDTQNLIADIKDVVNADQERRGYVTPRWRTDEAGEYCDGWNVRGRYKCCSSGLHSRDYHCKGEFVSNPEHAYDPKTGWRVVDGVRMKPIGPEYKQSSVEEADKRIPYVPSTLSVPVEISPDEGSGYVRIKARSGKLYVELDGTWTEMAFDRFVHSIRLAIAIS